MTFSFDPTAEDFRPVGNQAETLEIPDPEHASMYDDAEISEVERGGQYAITAYLKENVQEFRHLQQMRTKASFRRNLGIRIILTVLQLANHHDRGGRAPKATPTSTSNDESQMSPPKRTLASSTI
jgi:hypothetical protein